MKQGIRYKRIYTIVESVKEKDFANGVMKEWETDDAKTI